MYRLFLFLTIALGFVTQARAGGIDTLWTKPYDYLVGGYTVMAINHDSTIVAVGSEKGYVKLYNINTGDSIACFHRKDSKAYTLSFSPDGEHFAYAFSGGAINIFNLKTMKTDTILEYAYCKYNRDSSLFVLEGINKLVNLDKINYSVKRSLVFQDTMFNIILSNDYSKMVVIEKHRPHPPTYSFVMDIVDIEKFKLMKTIGISGDYYDINFSPDAKEIAVACKRGIDFYNIDSGKVTRRFTAEGYGCLSIHYFKDGKHFVAGKWNPNGLAFVDNSTLEVEYVFNTKLPDFDLPDDPSCLCFGKNESTLLEAGSVLSLIDISKFTSVNDANEKIGYIYPNPTTGNITIDVENVNQAKEVKITNSKGIATPCEYTISDEQITIQTATLPAGVYFVQLFAGATQQTFKFVKE